MNLILTFLVPAFVSMLFHTSLLRLSASLLRSKEITWASCAVFAFLSTLAVFALRRTPVSAAVDASMPLAIAMGVVLQALLGAAVFGCLLKAPSGSFKRAALRGGAVSAVAFSLFICAGLLALSGLDRLYQ